MFCHTNHRPHHRSRMTIQRRDHSIKTMSEQQQHETTTLYDRQEEYLAAQRAAVEATQVGRATLERAETQREQLDRADAYADDAEYALHKAGRVLRGMTWTGWLANAFTKGVGPPPEHHALSRHRQPVPMVYDNVPESCRHVAQCLQNYHANVQVLESCETDEQKDTCRLICDDMYRVAHQALEDLRRTNPTVTGHVRQFTSDLVVLRDRQVASQQRVRQLEPVTPDDTADQTSPAKAALFAGAAQRRPQEADGPKQQQQMVAADPIQQQQDSHLAFIQQSLGELGSLATSLQSSFATQNEIMDRLDNKADTILETSSQVTRRADRLVQAKSWAPIKATVAYGHVSIRHVASGNYLAVHNDAVVLVPQYHRDTCDFAFWQRQGQIYGIKSKCSSKWMGQSLLGNLTCSARTFGRREEWELAAGESSTWSTTGTRLLCASAGWGAGGYLLVHCTVGKNNDAACTVHIGGVGAEQRQKADVWHIYVMNDGNNARS